MGPAEANWGRCCLLGGVLVSDPQSPSGAGRSGLCKGRGQWMWMEIKSLQILAGGMRHTMQKSPDGEEVGVACRFVPCCLAGVCARGGISFLFSWWERASEGKEGGGKVTWDFFLLCLLCEQ